MSARIQHRSGPPPGSRRSSRAGASYWRGRRCTTDIPNRIADRIGGTSRLLLATRRLGSTSPTSVLLVTCRVVARPNPWSSRMPPTVPVPRDFLCEHTCGCRKPVPPGGTHESRLRHGLPLDPQLIQADDAIGQLTSHAQSGAASGTCFAVRVPHGSLPFPRLRSLVQRVRRYYGAIRLPSPFIPGLPPRRFVARRPLIRRTGRHGLSRFSRMKVPYMPWFSDRAEPASGSR